MPEGLSLPPRPGATPGLQRPNGGLPSLRPTTPRAPQPQPESAPVDNAQATSPSLSVEDNDVEVHTPAVTPVPTNQENSSHHEDSIEAPSVQTPASAFTLDEDEAPSEDKPSSGGSLASFWDEEKEEEETGPVIEESLPKVAVRAAADEKAVNIDDLLTAMLDQGGSDLHLSAKNYPMMRVHGSMTPIEGYPRLSGETIEQVITSVMSNEQRIRFDDEWELDFAYNLPGKSRFRVNVMKQRGMVSVVMRTIPWEIKTVEQLGIPEVIRDWSMLPRGLVLVTGPTGSGKSTTLAAVIDHANRSRAGHIVTIEDPIEFVHEHQKSVVNQREVGSDTKNFQAALKHVLRQDPDIILVGEMRDRETIEVALSAAETGHLVFGTLHTQSAAETISRIVDVFPSDAQQQIQTQLSATIKGIACQTLLKTRDGKGRCAAVEILVGSTGIASQIRDGKTGQIPSSIQAGGKLGMQTLDSALKELVESGKVRWQDAADKATNRAEFIAEFGGEEALIRKDRVFQQRFEESR